MIAPERPPADAVRQGDFSAQKSVGRPWWTPPLLPAAIELCYWKHRWAFPQANAFCERL